MIVLVDYKTIDGRIEGIAKWNMGELTKIMPTNRTYEWREAPIFREKMLPGYVLSLTDDRQPSDFYVPKR